MEIAIAIIFFVILVVITMYISLQKKEAADDPPMPVIHTSGIYSVIRKSPRENLHPAKPDRGSIQEQLANQTTDASGRPLTDRERAVLASDYEQRLEQNVQRIEKGDQTGVQRFLICAPDNTALCGIFKEKPFFITREDIYRHPELIPPYYPGCRCTLLPESEWDTASMDIIRFKPEQNPAHRIPHWPDNKKG